MKPERVKLSYIGDKLTYFLKNSIYRFDMYALTDGRILIEGNGRYEYPTEQDFLKNWKVIKNVV